MVCRFDYYRANAGGAWSPIGDVTTTMLWIGNKVTTAKLIMYLLIPSLVCMVVPVLLATTLPAFKGDIADDLDEIDSDTHKYGAPMLYIGLSAIVFVPVFKTLTHLPPCGNDAFSWLLLPLLRST